MRAWTAAAGLDGLVDLHLHFLPEPVTRKAWAFFDEASRHYGTDWPRTLGWSRCSHSRHARPRRGTGLVRRYPKVYIDTTMVGVAFAETFVPLAPGWPPSWPTSLTASSWVRTSRTSPTMTPPSRG